MSVHVGSKLHSGKYSKPAAKSKTGDPACAQAASDWRTHGMNPQIAEVLGKCRAIANKRKGEVSPEPEESGKGTVKDAKERLKAKAKEKKSPSVSRKSKSTARENLPPEHEPSEKAKRALASYRKANVEEQRYGEEQEKELVKGIGGYQSSDNKPVDVVLPRKGGKGIHGFEVKTIVTGANGKVTMKRSAIDKKHRWAEEFDGTLHSVIFDHRDRFEGGSHKDKYSGHEIYYKRGVGSFRIGGMYKIKDYDELKRLIDMPESGLPKEARVDRK